MQLQPRWNLAAVGPPPGVGDEAVRVLRDRGGAPLAWCALLDNPTKGYRITGYQGAYRWAARVPVHWLGYPRLPRVGRQAKEVSIAALGAVDDDVRLVAELLAGVADECRGHDFVMSGFCGDHPLAAAISKLRQVRYASRLYTVHYDEDCLGLDGRVIGLDVGLL